MNKKYAHLTEDTTPCSTEELYLMELEALDVNSLQDELHHEVFMYHSVDIESLTEGLGGNVWRKLKEIFFRIKATVERWLLSLFKSWDALEKNLKEAAVSYKENRAIETELSDMAMFKKLQCGGVFDKNTVKAGVNSLVGRTNYEKIGDIFGFAQEVMQALLKQSIDKGADIPTIKDRVKPFLSSLVKDYYKNFPVDDLEHSVDLVGGRLLSIEKKTFNNDMPQQLFLSLVETTALPKITITKLDMKLPTTVKYPAATQADVDYILKGFDSMKVYAAKFDKEYKDYTASKTAFVDEIKKQLDDTENSWMAKFLGKSYIGKAATATTKYNMASYASFFTLGYNTFKEYVNYIKKSTAK